MDKENKKLTNHIIREWIIAQGQRKILNDRKKENIKAVLIMFGFIVLIVIVGLLSFGFFPLFIKMFNWIIAF